MPKCYLCGTKRMKKVFGIGSITLCRKCAVATLKVWVKNIKLKAVIG